MGWLSSLSALVSPVTEYIKGRQALKTIELDGKLRLAKADTDARIAMLSNEQSHDINLDFLTVKERGWKDDIITYVLLSPFCILMFNPILAVAFAYNPATISSAMVEGFVAMDSMPEYMWYGLLIVMADVFGLRGMLRKVLNKVT